MNVPASEEPSQPRREPLRPTMADLMLFVAGAAVAMAFHRVYNTSMRSVDATPQYLMEWVIEPIRWCLFGVAAVVVARRIQFGGGATPGEFLAMLVLAGTVVHLADLALFTGGVMWRGILTCLIFFVSAYLYGNARLGWPIWMRSLSLAFVVVSSSAFLVILYLLLRPAWFDLATGRAMSFVLSSFMQYIALIVAIRSAFGRGFARFPWTEGAGFCLYVALWAVSHLYIYGVMIELNGGDSVLFVACSLLFEAIALAVSWMLVRRYAASVGPWLLGASR
ncbi:MAG: hypothetical protein U0794_01090 [Isosphaeraceae bacterium]